MATKNEAEVRTDGRGRIIDRNGKPLRDRSNRSYGKQPFKGANGKKHPRSAKLAARQKAFDEMKQTSGYRRPGSYKK